MHTIQTRQLSLTESLPTSYPLVDLGGAGPVVSLAIANGFPPQTYRPLLDPFTDRHRVVCLLPRALWGSSLPPESLTSWQQMADDLVAGLRQHHLTDVIAIGHSVGAVTSTLAAIAEPERFRALVLLDPSFLPPALLAVIRLLRATRQSHRFPLARASLRRRTKFANVEQAFEYWRVKPLFADWPAETIRLYAESMTRSSNNGGSVELAWPPQWESQVYQTIFTDWQREIPKLRSLLPVLVIRGTETNTFTGTAERIAKRLLPDATYASIEGHGHLFPQSAPVETRRIIESWLESHVEGTNHD